ncbi:MAG: hypothetical protein AAF418_00950 [Pseudomonadota bacterium]
MPNHYNLLFFSIIRVVLVVLAIHMVAIWPAKAEGWLPGLEDVPIAPAFAPDLQSLLLFDHPGGRIVEIHLHSEQAYLGEQALGFYHETLVQLGWVTLHTDHDATFIRGAEQLVIEIIQNQPQTTLRLKLVPNPS